MVDYGSSRRQCQVSVRDGVRAFVIHHAPVGNAGLDMGCSRGDGLCGRAPSTSFDSCTKRGGGGRRQSSGGRTTAAGGTAW